MGWLAAHAGLSGITSSPWVAETRVLARACARRARGRDDMRVRASGVGSGGKAGDLLGVDGRVGRLGEDQRHRLGGEVAALHEPLVSLKVAGMSRASRRRRVPLLWLRLWAARLLRSLSALCRRRWSCCSCPGFSDRLWASAGQTNGGACRDGCAPRHAAAQALKGCWRARMCQAAIRTLRATAALAGLALPCRVLVSV
jgi:hypothetical protein